MENICNLTGKGILRRLKAIEQTPEPERRRRFGRGWPWDVTNGTRMIREHHPELIGQMSRIYRPFTVDDLHAVSPGRITPNRKDTQ